MEEDIQKYSEPLDGKFIGTPPGWMVANGTFLIAGLFVLFLIVLAQINYNDVLRAEVKISTKIPPSYVASKLDGLLHEIKVSSGDIVKRGDILAVIQNSAKTSDVIDIEKKLLGNYDTISTVQKLQAVFPTELNLGESQIVYNNFVGAYQKLINFKSLNRKSSLGEGLRIQSESQHKAIETQRKKLKLSRQRYEIAKSRFDKQGSLYEKGVISQSELATFEEGLLSSEQAIQDDYKALNILLLQSNELKTAYNDNSLGLLELENDYKTSLRALRQELLSSIEQWRLNFVLAATSTGRVSVFDIWEEYQNVEEGDYLFSIVPETEKENELIGKLKVPVSNFGRVHMNNRVVIKLDNYPFRQWGSLEGSIAYISDVPKKGENVYYPMYLDINSLETSFGKKIDFKQEMSGVAEIILEESSVLERIFYQFKSMLE